MLPLGSELELLIVESLPSTARLHKSCIDQAGYKVRVASSGQEALLLLHDRPAHIVVVDLDLPDMRGVDLIKDCVARSCQTGFIVVTANGSVQTAVDAIRAGAHDFIVKPFSSDRFITSLANVTEQIRLKLDLTRLKNDLDRRNICGIIGQSKPMKQVFSVLEAAALSDAAVFITGESGTGKELAAEAIHSLSARKNRPFVAINCGAIPVDLIESEMFGHLRGSFTGAVADRKGAVQQAHGGTLFLDEICEMQFDLQAKLLRFLQSGAVRPVGATRTEQVDVRIVCATNREPMEEVQEGRFREDLYYRLHVLPVHLPPLRDRQEDIVILAQHFLKQYSIREGKKFIGFDDEVLALIADFPWPGNIRQMQNVLRNAIVMNDSELMTANMLSISNRQNLAKAATDHGIKLVSETSQVHRLSTNDPSAWQFVHDIKPLLDVEQAAVERAIDLCAGNIPRAAAFLSVSPSTIYRKMKVRTIAVPRHA